MIVIMATGAAQEQIDSVIAALEERGYGIHLSRGVEKTIIGAIGALDEEKQLVAQQIEILPGVERVIPILKPYKLANKEFHPEPTVIEVGAVAIGGNRVVVMAGPCSVESEEQVLTTARAVRDAGATVLRGGAFKPSTSPYGFRGLAKEGLELLRLASQDTGLRVITEVMDPRDVELVADYADILQIGTRNMTNFVLLREVGLARKPVMLKRGLASTIEEWLQAAEYIMLGGNYQVMLCERGIRTFEVYTRNTLDINAVPAVKELTHLPVIVDPSHGTGRASLVASVARAAVAAGADGVMIEVHPHPEKALKDGYQSLRPDDFARLMGQLAAVAKAVGREL
jgi:3-deoxy-7-phosphoheptulonate synthase